MVLGVSVVVMEGVVEQSSSLQSTKQREGRHAVVAIWPSFPILPASSPPLTECHSHKKLSPSALVILVEMPSQKVTISLV